jgi:Ca2+/Na+ antiporter
MSPDLRPQKRLHENTAEMFMITNLFFDLKEPLFLAEDELSVYKISGSFLYACVYVYIYLFPLIPVERACKAFVNPTAEKVF